MLKKKVLENPQILGWLGILPFIFSSFFVLFEIRFSLELKVLGLLYASSILGFLGAVYWGYLLKSEAHEHILWAWGIATSLVAWFSLIIIGEVKVGYQKQMGAVTRHETNTKNA